MDMDYSSYYYRSKRPKKEEKSRTFLRFFLILLIAGSFALFIFLFSRARPGDSYLRVNDRQKCVEVYDATWYAVEMGSYSSETAASSKAQSIRARGGAGYVFETEGTYRVLAAVYKSKADAESVIVSLRAGNDECTLFEVTIPAGRVAGLSKGKPLNTLYESLMFFYDTLAELEEIGYALDTGKIDLAGFRERVSAIASKRQQRLAGLEKEKAFLPCAQEIKAVYIVMAEKLDSVAAASTTTALGGVAIKWETARFLDSYISLLNKIY